MSGGINGMTTTEGRKGLVQERQGTLRVVMGTCFLVILPWIAPSTTLWAATGEESVHFSKFLEIPLKGGSIPNTLHLPLYEQKTIQYFSAGLGKEERSLAYPPYSLKLIFVKGKRAFLAGVDVEIILPDQTTLLTIPGDEVQGPWLFLNLAPGKYVVKATDSSGNTIEKSVSLSAKESSTVYCRWP